MPFIWIKKFKNHRIAKFNAQVNVDIQNESEISLAEQGDAALKIQKWWKNSANVQRPTPRLSESSLSHYKKNNSLADEASREDFNMRLVIANKKYIYIFMWF